MPRTPFSVLSAATIVAALALSGCSNHDESKPAPSPAAPQSSAAAVAPSDPGAALPAPEALTDVLYRLADPAVKGSDKLALVESTTPDDAVTMDRFAAALRDGGFTPLTVTAQRHQVVRPSSRTDALATVNVTTSNPANPGGFTFPMEFRSHDGGWQLSRETADMLLAFGNARTGAGRSSPAPAPARSPSDADADALNVDRLAGVRHPARRRPLAQGEALAGAADRRRTAAPVQRVGGRDRLPGSAPAGRDRRVGGGRRLSAHVVEVLDAAERLVAARPEIELLSARRGLHRSDDWA